MSKVLVGTRPSGKLHIGHYASVIKPAVKYEADVLIAQYHAPHEDPEDMRQQLKKFSVNFKLQEINPSIFFKLLELTPSHLLNAMPQYKAKEKNALMYTYPVLMAHDLIGYDRVIVGEDQRPHMEFARDVLPRIGEKCPEVIYSDYKIMDLRHPENKMSKSEPNTCLFIDDPDYETKITKAVTTEQGVENLQNIYHILTNEHAPEGIQNSELKSLLIQAYRKLFKGDSGE